MDAPNPLSMPWPSEPGDLRRSHASNQRKKQRLPVDSAGGRLMSRWEDAKHVLGMARRREGRPPGAAEPESLRPRSPLDQIRRSQTRSCPADSCLLRGLFEKSKSHTLDSLVPSSSTYLSFITRSLTISSTKINTPSMSILNLSLLNR